MTDDTTKKQETSSVKIQQVSQELRQQIREKVFKDCKDPEMRQMLIKLLNEFADCFKKPKFGQARVPPVIIPLKPGATPVNVRPYRMSHVENTAADCEVDKMQRDQAV